MPESKSAGPSGYAEVSGTAGTPEPGSTSSGPPQVAEPFTPPDISSLGDGVSAGGTAGPGGNGGGSLAHKISGVAGVVSNVVKLIGDA